MAKQAMADNAKAVRNGMPTDTLRDAGQELLGVVLKRAASSATDRVADFSDRLTNVSENGEGLRSLVRRPDRGDQRDDRGDDGGDDGEESGSGSGFGSVLSGLKDKVKGVFSGSKGDSGGKKKLKMTNMVETLDVGLPLRTTYDLWTRFTDFPTFMKKVESVTQAEDEITQWKAQVFFSHREWEATIQEQVPDSHIVWRSKGAKGHVNGAVTFAALGPNMTRVALVLEYHPQGLFERTGNLWRAQGRRARLEFKHFRRHAMTQALLHPEEIEGWRGEIHDGEVVKTHEEALEDDQGQSGQPDEEQDYDDMDEVDAAEAEELEKEGWEIEPIDEEDEDLDEEDDEEDAAVDEDEPVDNEASDDDREEPYEDEEEPDEGEDLYDEEADEEEPYQDEGDDGYDEEPEEEEDERPTRRRRRQPVGAGRGVRGSAS
jgi:Polyketide cyclase / dehydrase and lipid transport